MTTTSILSIVLFFLVLSFWGAEEYFHGYAKDPYWKLSLWERIKTLIGEIFG